MKENLLIEERHLTEHNRHSLKPDSGEHVFRYCFFEGVKDLELQLGVSIESSFLSCSFSECELYDPFFNGTLFFQTKFERCTFHGGSFRGCTFVACEFDDCRLEHDNHGAECIFDDVRWYDCRESGSPELGKQFPVSQPATLRSRWRFWAHSSLE